MEIKRKLIKEGDKWRVEIPPVYYTEDELKKVYKKLRYDQEIKIKSQQARIKGASEELELAKKNIARDIENVTQQMAEIKSTGIDFSKAEEEFLVSVGIKKKEENKESKK
ncbi:MAG: hypothetical protein ACTSXD_08455 [Candidatus Heimdallarchaeaceae archaeon]